MRSLLCLLIVALAALPVDAAGCGGGSCNVRGSISSDLLPQEFNNNQFRRPVRGFEFGFGVGAFQQPIFQPQPVVQPASVQTQAPQPVAPQTFASQPAVQPVLPQTSAPQVATPRPVWTPPAGTLAADIDRILGARQPAAAQPAPPAATRQAVARVTLASACLNCHSPNGQASYADFTAGLSREDRIESIARIRSGNMPKGRTLSALEKQTLIAELSR